MKCLMWSEEVVISDPERQIVVGTIVVIKTVRWPIRGLVCTVQTFDQLLVGTELFRNGIIVCKAENLSNLKLECFTVFAKELLCGKRISAVSISYKAELFG